MNIKVTRDCGYDTVRRTMQHEAKDIMQNRQLEEAALPLRQWREQSLVEGFVSPA